jgi:tight adherence protein B
MNALTGAVIALIGCGGVWLAVAGLVGVRESERALPDIAWTELGWRFGIAMAGFLSVWLWTGWPMAGASVAAVALMVPVFMKARTLRDEQLERSDALATWAEMLRDTIASHAGLRQAIFLTSNVAPLQIREELRRLAIRTDRMSLPEALRTFASEAEDPVADLIVAALVIADENQARNLTELLSEIASSARQQSAMRRRIETGRARTYASSKWIVVITFALAGGLILFTPQFLEPYDSFGGQIVLAMIGALFAGAVWSLISLSKPESQPRLLAGVEADGG